MIGILGGGLAGLTVAAHCKQDCEVLEASDRVGGHCKSTIEQGYTFDEGPHIIFSKKKKTLDYMLSLLGDNIVQGRRNNKIYYKGEYIKYPFENGIGELEPQERFECLYGYLQRIELSTYPNFKEWLYGAYGSALTEKYLLPYNEKIWKCSAEEMGWAWADERLPRPNLQDILKSACGLSTEGYTHQLNFYYPKRGGIQALVDAMVVHSTCPIQPNWPVASVYKAEFDCRGKWAVLKNTPKEEDYRVYDKIVSTLPLNEMVEIFEGVPQEIKDAAKQLRFNSLITITLGIHRAAIYDSTPLTAVYVPDPNKIFHRLSFPQAFSKENGDTIQAEITCNYGDAVWGESDARLAYAVFYDLIGMHLVKATDIGSYAKVQRLKYGYPVPTFTYRENLKKVHTYFEEQGVLLCGRNAEFEYINMDQCIEHGMAIAEQL